jgi:hypothetical protein
MTYILKSHGNHLCYEGTISGSVMSSIFMSLSISLSLSFCVVSATILRFSNFLCA